MSDPNTIRILELDGGGERGYFSLSWFQNFVTQWGIDPATIAQNFDVICGTSVGGIMALSLAYGLTPVEMVPFFTTQGTYIFSLSSLFPSWRPNAATKVGLILANIPFYQSSGSTALAYGSGLLAATLQNTFGANTLQNLKTNVVIPSYNNDTNTFVLFSNANIGGFIGQDFLISDVGLATGSAPVYLPPWKIGGYNYIDGGVYQNNPAQFGIPLGKTLKPNANRICVLSIGTGLGEIGFDDGGSSGIPLAANPLTTNASSSTVIVAISTTSSLTNGQNVTISGATDTGGILAINLNITSSITIINSTSFFYTANASATSSVVGGGSNVVLDYIEESSRLLLPNKRLIGKKRSFHPSGIRAEQFKQTPVYKELLRKNPGIASQISSFGNNKTSPFDTIESIFGLFEIASTGGQESVAQSLLLQSVNTLDQLYYYRFNAVLDPGQNTELDNTDLSIRTYYDNYALSLFNGDIENISTFLGHLTA